MGLWQRIRRSIRTRPRSRPAPQAPDAPAAKAGAGTPGPGKAASGTGHAAGGRTADQGGPGGGPGQGIKDGASPALSGGLLSPRLVDNLETFHQLFGDSDDYTFRSFTLGEEAPVEGAILYLEGVADSKTINDTILEALMVEARLVPPNKMGKQQFWDRLYHGLMHMGSVKQATTVDEVSYLVATGFVAFFLDGTPQAMLVEAKGWDKRGISQPASKAVIRGPRDGFIETLRVNTAMIRRRIRDPNLKLKTVQIGRRTKTDVAILYLAGVANPGLVDEVKQRLDRLDVDAVLESGYIEQLIEDDWLSPFPQVQASERPDECAAALLEGRVCILVDNTPFALIVPVALNTLMHSSEDYYHRWLPATAMRVVRIIANFLALLLPALYIAVTSFHSEVLPTKLALSLAASREGVPFPTWLEALIMEFSFELLAEAGVRLPKNIGQTIGIVGALIIGQAAVQAGIVSQVVVIVVAFTSIGSFSMPSYDVALTFRILRFFLMGLAALGGLYGIILGLVLILAHLARLKSFGVGYLGPLAPGYMSDRKDTLLRAPLVAMHRRPYLWGPVDTKRLDDKRRESPTEGSP